MTPAISIITPVYNGAPFLREAIESIRGQSFVDWEYIIVDDASTDDSLAIAKDHAALDSRIRVVSLGKNSGPAAARNAGLSATSGRLISFLDADDLWHPDFLLKQKTSLESSSQQTVGIFCHSVHFNAETGKVLAYHEPRSGHYDLASFLFQGCPPGNGSSLMIRRSAFQTAGEFDISMRRGEDTDMWLRLLASTPDGIFWCQEELLVRRRIHPAAASTGKNFMTSVQMHTYPLRLDRYLDRVPAAARSRIYLANIAIISTVHSSEGVKLGQKMQAKALALPDLSMRERAELLLLPPLLGKIGPPLYQIFTTYRQLKALWRGSRFMQKPELSGGKVTS